MTDPSAAIEAVARAIYGEPSSDPVQHEGDLRSARAAIAALRGMGWVEQEKHAEAIDALVSMCEQYLPVRDGKLHHDFMSAGEHAFDALGWEDTGHPVPEMTCDEPGCGRGSDCGWPSPTGYRRTCSLHYVSGTAAPKGNA